MVENRISNIIIKLILVYILLIGMFISLVNISSDEFLTQQIIESKKG